jgi:hypothetical protein
MFLAEPKQTNIEAATTTMIDSLFNFLTPLLFEQN